MPFSRALEKTLMLGKIEGRRRRGRQRMRWLDGITDLMDMSLSTTFKVRRGGCEEIPSYKVRSSSCALLAK